MPCNSDYLAAGPSEIAFSQIACLIDELNGKPINEDYWGGYHPRVYSKSYDGDALIKELCDRLQNTDVTKYSLEMQIWWRGHQKADKDRLEREMQKQKTEAEKSAALAKLTDYERKLLGI